VVGGRGVREEIGSYYLDKLNEAGFHKGLCRYCSLSMASTVLGDTSQAPWGGLPSRHYWRLASRAIAFSGFLKPGRAFRCGVDSAGRARGDASAATMVGAEPASLA
jgi:hypothetical protein